MGGGGGGGGNFFKSNFHDIFLHENDDVWNLSQLLLARVVVFKLTYITILLYYTIHVVSFRKTILISTIGTHHEIKYWRRYPVS